MRFNTIAVTGGFSFDPETGATNPPLHLSNAYQFKSAEHAANLFDLTEAGHIYTRLHNPTTDVLEARLAELEGGTAAVATASGHAAEMMLFLELCGAGDEIVASNRLYGGTMNIFAATLPKYGIRTSFADQNDPAAWEALVTDKTKLFYMECLANPDSGIPDFDGIIAVAKKHGIVVVIDNTFATPYLFRPIDVGANLVVHSTTKYLCGNGTVMGGAVVDLGNFDWAAHAKRYPDFSTPDASYHGVVFAETFKDTALATRLRLKALRDMGATPSPFNSYLTLMGIQTLPLRMARHVENAYRVALWLSTHPKVKSVSYPGVLGHAQHELAKKYFPKGPGGLFTFEAQDYDTAKRVIESVKLCLHAANLGDTRTILTHPASTTHRQSSPEKLGTMGISREMVRVSVGIEDADDIIEDLAQALG
ncbi:MAG: O-acetylhomoserine aminocarboxypropyltransferase/cysteine synthase [Deferribacteraceae bacterium]|jgi:O-acetylhomoserine (thiol)-lyase|nr:O-acetylhomoserine aminocarboxypropyltransferase/cysteine synthase [Deferribacteraceae bacterium]